MSRWMLDFKGTNAETSVGHAKETVEALQAGDPERARETIAAGLDACGSLVQEVKKFIAESGLTYSDSGFGEDRWHIGIPFEDPLIALSFMIHARARFREALKHHWLSLHLITWSED